MSIVSMPSTVAPSIGAIALVSNDKGARIAALPNRKAWLEANHPNAKNAEGKRLYADYLKAAQPLMAACQNKAVEGMAMVKVTLSKNGASATVRYAKPPETKETKSTKAQREAKEANLKAAKSLLESNVAIDVVAKSLGLTETEIDAYVEANA